MKKINILYTIWAPSYGGAERFVLNLVKTLDKKKYNITIFSDSTEKGPLQKDFEASGAEVIYAKHSRFTHPLKYKKQLRKIINDKKIDVIHANDDQNMIFPLLAKLKETKFIAHAHNTKFQFTRSRIISGFTTHMLSKYITKHSDLRLSCGKEAGQKTFCGKSFEIIPNGIELGKFKFSSSVRQKMRKKYGIDDNTIVLLNVGRIVEQKNHVFLLDVFNEYYKLNKDSKLVIIGDGKESIKDKIKNAEPKENILLLPSQENISNFYSMADFFVMTSLFEGLPIVAIEAQANDLKCIFSDTITKEADCSGSSKFLPLEDSPRKWANALYRMNSKRTNSKNSDIKKYDIKNISKQIDKIYSSITIDPQK
ncbi:glycosyltransferase [Candidatus Saccharibacteria bacterium]|nr:glycosyltransferase [Candidatus Saccharibacteria bacterium]